MPTKKAAVDASPPSASEAPVEEKSSDAAAQRKVATHPSTAIMVKEALQALDSRKGASSIAIQNYIKQQYPTVNEEKLKNSVRKAVKKGLEAGTLVRPAKSNVTSTGAIGKFRLAPTVKEAKPKTENTDPNVQKEPKAAKDGAKKPKKAGATKKKDAATDQDQDQDQESEEESKPAKKSKKQEEAAPSKPAPSKPAPAKKPKGKKAAETADDTETPTAAKPKAAKAPKEAKAGKASQSKSPKAGKAPAAKAAGKGGKKSAQQK